jgi:methionyl-tRNA formyltransferase
MRVIIITSSPTGYATLCLARLAQIKDIEIALIVLNENSQKRRGNLFFRKLMKTLKIGILGALNGIRMRKWYSEDVNEILRTESLECLADRLKIRVEKTPTINCQRTMDLIRAENADVGISIGNPYIGRRVFSIPKLGMINCHHELLPEYQGAQAVIWQIHEGSAATGFTFHVINEHIDTGAILYRSEMDVIFESTMRKTVAVNVARICIESADALARILSDFQQYLSGARPQGPGRRFTTPTIWQFWRMCRNHKQLRISSSKRAIRS